MALASAPPAPSDVTLAWNPSPTAEVSGYRLYFGPASRFYTNVLDVQQQTSVTVSRLREGSTYFFAVTSYTVDGLESDFSGEVPYTVPFQNRARLSIAPGAGTNLTLRCSGVPNESYEILVSADLTDWRVLDQVTLDGVGFLEYIAPTPPVYHARFYCLRLRSRASVPTYLRPFAETAD